MVAELTTEWEGVLVGDAGYFVKEAVFWGLYKRHRYILSATRKHMKRVMSGEQKQLLRDRSRIETVWDVL
ncbi:MAG: transposase [Treponema sp.]|nr:transposase [Treponema sp.]